MFFQVVLPPTFSHVSLCNEANWLGTWPPSPGRKSRWMPNPRLKPMLWVGSYVGGGLQLQRFYLIWCCNLWNWLSYGSANEESNFPRWYSYQWKLGCCWRKKTIRLNQDNMGLLESKLRSSRHPGRRGLLPAVQLDDFLLDMGSYAASLSLVALNGPI